MLLLNFSECVDPTLYLYPQVVSAPLSVQFVVLRRYPTTRVRSTRRCSIMSRHKPTFKSLDVDSCMLMLEQMGLQKVHEVGEQIVYTSRWSHYQSTIIHQTQLSVFLLLDELKA